MLESLIPDFTCIIIQTLCCVVGDCLKCLLGDPEVTANPYCNFAYLYWEGCVIRSIYLR